MANSIATNHIYEIFKSCRLCGAKKGYKMPIIQSAFGLVTSDDVELQDKIRECVQIEVKEDDKMPPLICEACADTVTKYYEFLETCRLTDRITRQRLGLELQEKVEPERGTSSEECILGITEPVYQVPLAATPKPGPKSKTKIPETVTLKKPGPKSKTEVPRAGPKSKTKVLNESESPRIVAPVIPRPGPKSKTKNLEIEVSKPKLGEKKIDVVPVHRPGPKSKTKIKEQRIEQKIKEGKVSMHRTQKRMSRELTELKKDLMFLNLDDSKEARPSRTVKENKDVSKENVALENVPITRTREQIKSTDKSKTGTPKTAPKKVKDDESEDDDLPLARPRGKRSAPDSTPKTGTPKTEPVPAKKAKTKPTPSHACQLCDSVFRTTSLLNAHLKTHVVGFTPTDQACNACREWFPSKEETTIHHEWHIAQNRPYRCRHCNGRFKFHNGYEEHFEKKPCIPFLEKPKPAPPPPPPPPAPKRVKCDNCARTYSTPANLKKHEKHCTVAKLKSAFSSPEPSVRDSLLTMEVRVGRCDELIPLRKSGKAYVGAIGPNFGLDRKRKYPYLKKPPNRRLKKESPAATKTVIKEKKITEDYKKKKITGNYKEEDYVHWDSDLSSDSDDENDKRDKVDSLTTLSLKTIFSKRCLGKVPRKVRKVKKVKLFDSIFNNDVDDSFNAGINSLIDGLGDDDDEDHDINKILKDNVEKKDEKDTDSIASASLIDTTIGDADGGSFDGTVVNLRETGDRNNYNKQKSEDEISVDSASLVDTANNDTVNQINENKNTEVESQNNEPVNVSSARNDEEIVCNVTDNVNKDFNNDINDKINLESQNKEAASAASARNEKEIVGNTSTNIIKDIFDGNTEKVDSNDEDSNSGKAKDTKENIETESEIESVIDNDSAQNSGFVKEKDNYTDFNKDLQDDKHIPKSKNNEEFTIDALIGNVENFEQKSTNLVESHENGNIDDGSHKNSGNFKNGTEHRSEIDSDDILKDIDAQISACGNTEYKSKNPDYSSLSLDNISEEEFNFDV